MSNQPFQFTTPCPNCGATLVFQSTASVMGVCSYCQTTVSRSAEVIEQQGKISQILEDFSPLQIGSTGVYNNVPFSVIGRLHMSFDAGEWFEWHIMYADGRVGWLSESDGTYSITQQVDDFEGAPAYNNIRLNTAFDYKGTRYNVSDINKPRCIGGEGELPFLVEDESEVHVCDARHGKQLISLDYGESDEQDSNGKPIVSYPPTVYVGENMSLDELDMQMLRDAQSIAVSAGDIGDQQNSSTECPNCGDSIDFVSGMAEHVVCRSCFSEIKVENHKAKLINTNFSLATYRMTLNIGDSHLIGMYHYTIIGAVGYAEVGDPCEWVSYLLYSADNTDAAFLWVTEAKDEDTGKTLWTKSDTLLEQPAESTHTAHHNGRSWQKMWHYSATVNWAIGAFYWQVKMGDQITYEEFGSEKHKLIKETSATDILWNESQIISDADMAAWFGIKKKQSTSRTYTEDDSSKSNDSIFEILMGVLWIINLPIMLFKDGSFILTFIASIAILILSVMASNQ